MEPTLLPGDRLYVERFTNPRHRLERGEIVVLRDPEGTGRWLVKRVGATPEDPGPSEGPGVPAGTVFVVGDNASSSRDSRHFGPVALTSVLGVVRSRYWPVARRGPVPVA